MSQIDLFNFEMDTERNLLPKDGTVNYFGKVFSEAEANRYFEILLNTIDWKNDEAMIFGKRLLPNEKWRGTANVNLNIPIRKLPKKLIHGHRNYYY